LINVTKYKKNKSDEPLEVENTREFISGRIK